MPKLWLISNNQQTGTLIKIKMILRMNYMTMCSIPTVWKVTALAKGVATKVSS